MVSAARRDCFAGSRLIYHYKWESLYLNLVAVLYRNRAPSVPEILNNTANGDAFFADYTIVAGIAHHF